MLSVQGTIRNTGDPAVTVSGHNGGLKRGKTGAISLKGGRALQVPPLRKVNWDYPIVGAFRETPDQELVTGTDTSAGASEKHP